MLIPKADRKKIHEVNSHSPNRSDVGISETHPPAAFAPIYTKN